MDSNKSLARSSFVFFAFLLFFFFWDELNIRLTSTSYIYIYFNLPCDTPLSVKNTIIFWFFITGQGSRAGV